MYNNRYYQLNQTLLRLFGLWPHKKTKIEHFRAICCYVLLISFAFTQLAQLVIADLNINTVTRILSDALPAVLYIVKFNMFFFDTKKAEKSLKIQVKQITQMINDWRMLIDEHEIKIAKQYARQGKYYTIIVIVLLVFGLFIMTIITLLPDILDFVWPLNESRVRYLLSMDEYYKYQTQFYPILLYIIISTVIGTLITLSVSMMLMLSTLHCCAIFKISSYRIEHTVDKKVIPCSDKRNIMVKRIISAVELHRKATKLQNLLFTNFTTSFLIVLILGIASLTLSLYRLLRAIINMNLNEIWRSIGFVGAHKMYLFGTSYSGQLIIDHADELFHTIYKSLWYIAPTKVQKLLLFMMQICLKTPSVNVGGVYVSLMQTFTKVSSTSISYVMVLYSIQ